MSGIRRSIHSRLEILTGLNLFDAGVVPKERIRAYRQFFDQKAMGKTKGGPLSDSEKISIWYDAFMPDDVKLKAGAVAGYLRTVSIAIGIIGFLAGSGAAGYLFYYDGSSPVNVLPVLALFAFFPLVFLIFSAVFSLIESRRSGRLPLFFRWIEAPVRSRLRKMVPGQEEIARDETTNKSADDPASARQVDYRHNNHVLPSITSSAWLIHSEPVRLYLKQNLQLAGTAYLTGALLWMLFHVVTTDLAFSWSSTLEVQGETLYKITQTISAPWSHLLPFAAIDADTVEATRFYRAERGDFRPASSGRWWPFIFMAILVYGFVPKLLAYVWYRWRFLKSADRSLLLSDSGRDILAFLEEPLLRTEGDDRFNAASLSGATPEQPVTATESCVVLIWGLCNIKLTGIQHVLNRRILISRHIGGLNSMELDRQVVMQAAQLSLENNHCDILVLVPYEESPVISLEKRLHVLLGESPQSRIIILPVIEDIVQNKQSYEINWSVRVDELNRYLGKKRIFLDVRNLIDSKYLSNSA